MQKELQFRKCDGEAGYEATVTVDADYNLHLERTQRGSVRIMQSTVQTGDKAERFYAGDKAEVWEDDFDGIVYPKYIRIVSGSLVRKGYITEVEE